MRLLHVSDWHLGRSLGRVARVADHDQVLEEIVELARREKPDLIVHSGDLFDQARPAVDDLRRAVEALRELSGYAPTVVLAGNHDSAALFEVLDEVVALALPGGTPSEPGWRLRLLGRARPPRRGGILTLPIGGGEQVARLAPVPFVHPNSLLRAFEVDPERWTADYHDQVRDVEDALGRGLVADYRPDRDVLLFAAHLHVGGARFSTSERPLHVSDHYATSTEHLPAVSYAAFGHIHRPQELPGAILGRYAGSPIQLDFGEADEDKSVVLVDARPATAAHVEVVPLRRGRRLRRVSGTLAELARLDGVDGCIVQAIVDTDEPTPDLAARLVQLWPQAAFHEVLERRAAGGDRASAAEDRPVGAERPTAELFREYLVGAGVADRQVDAAMGVFTRLLGVGETDGDSGRPGGEVAGVGPVGVGPLFDELELFELPERSPGPRQQPLFGSGAG